MPDPYASIAQMDETIQTRLAQILELRAADEQLRLMADQYLSEIKLAAATSALEIGCGTGAICRRIAERFAETNVVGVDPSLVLLRRARELSGSYERLSFREGDGRCLPFADASFDLVVFHTTLCHIPEPQDAIREAYRVLRPDGWLGVFDGDYVTTTVATSEHDPLQQAVEAMTAAFVHNRWLTRRLPTVLASEGFTVGSVRGYGFTQVREPDYMLTVVDRGADLLAQAGTVGKDVAEQLKGEARRRASSAFSDAKRSVIPTQGGQ
jgi:ubiquinone/menaquinone biosynthesis C-methylase UbiE